MASGTEPIGADQPAQPALLSGKGDRQADLGFLTKNEKFKKLREIERKRQKNITWAYVGILDPQKFFYTFP